jgi:hypothetical protein
VVCSTRVRKTAFIPLNPRKSKTRRADSRVGERKFLESDADFLTRHGAQVPSRFHDTAKILLTVSPVWTLMKRAQTRCCANVGRIIRIASDSTAKGNEWAGHRLSIPSLAAVPLWGRSAPKRDRGDFGPSRRARAAGKAAPFRPTRHQPRGPIFEDAMQIQRLRDLGLY